MNGIDLAVAVVVLLCAVRGYWRGFFRECFGLLALVAGAAAALHFTPLGEAVVERYVALPAPAQTIAAYVGIFVIVQAMVAGIGVLLSRAVKTRVLRTLNGLAGATLGAGKGAVVVAFLLLVLHLFPVAPRVDGQIMASAIARPLLTAASDAMRCGGPYGGGPDPRGAM